MIGATLKSRNPASESATEKTAPRIASAIDATTSVARPTRKKVTSAPIILSSGREVPSDQAPPLLPRSDLIVRVDPVDLDHAERPRNFYRQLPGRGVPVGRVEVIPTLDQTLGIEYDQERILRDLDAEPAGDSQQHLAQTQIDGSVGVAVPAAGEVQRDLADAPFYSQGLNVRVSQPTDL